MAEPCRSANDGRQWFSALLLAVLLCLTSSLRAAPENITDGELALLPAYCQDVQAIRYGNETYNPSPRAAHWVSLLGKAFWALHHYCWGQIHVRRSQAPGLQQVLRQGMLHSGIADYFYVLNNAPRDFPLAPEILLRVGEAELMRGNFAAASEAFTQARELKPDYWPAYARWIDALLKINQKATAKELAEKGLRYAPQSKELIERYRALGGDPSKVVPIAAPVPRAAVAASAPQADGPSAAPANPPAAAPSASAAASQ